MGLNIGKPDKSFTGLTYGDDLAIIALGILDAILGFIGVFFPEFSGIFNLCLAIFYDDINWFRSLAMDDDGIESSILHPAKPGTSQMTAETGFAKFASDRKICGEGLSANLAEAFEDPTLEVSGWKSAYIVTGLHNAYRPVISQVFSHKG
jgi:hypothetical protein